MTELQHLKNLIEIAQQQIKEGRSYNFHDPNQQIVLAFLQAKIKQFDNATNTISQLTLNNNHKELLLKQINQSV